MGTCGYMDTKEIFNCCRRIYDARFNVEEILVEKRESERALKQQEADYLCDEYSSLVKGKNAEERAAKLFILTLPSRILVDECDRNLGIAKANLEFEQNQLQVELAILAQFGRLEIKEN